jgi:hypothetical protein
MRHWGTWLFSSPSCLDDGRNKARLKNSSSLKEKKQKPLVGQRQRRKFCHDDRLKFFKIKRGEVHENITEDGLAFCEIGLRIEVS